MKAPQCPFHEVTELSPPLRESASLRESMKRGHPYYFRTWTDQNNKEWIVSDREAIDQYRSLVFSGELDANQQILRPNDVGDTTACEMVRHIAFGVHGCGVPCRNDG